MSNLAKKLEGKSTRLTGKSGKAGAGRPAAMVGRLMSLETARIKPDPNQPRKHFDPAALEELGESLKEHGQIQPVVVRLVEGEPVLVAGERRWQAARLAGMERLDAVIKDLDPERAMLLALIENLEREDLGPLEEAEALAKLKAKGRTLKDLAKITKLAPSTISEKLSLCDLPEEVKADLRQDPKALPLRQLVEVVKLARRTSPENAMRLYNHAKKHGMTRAEFRRPGDAGKAPEVAEEQAAAPTPEPESEASQAGPEPGEDREQGQGEAQGADLEGNLRVALLHAREGARERWAEPIKTGLDDAGLKLAISLEFGEFTRLNRGKIDCSFVGGKEPKFWLGFRPYDKPTLAGKRLVDTARVLLGVPYAGNDEGAEVDSKSARKERRQLKAVQEGGYHGARLKQSLVDVMEGPKLIGSQAEWKELVWQVRTLGSIVAQCEQWLEEARIATAAEGEGEMARDLNKADRARLLELVESGVPEAAIRERMGPLGKPLTVVEFDRNFKRAMVDAGRIGTK